MNRGRCVRLAEAPLITDQRGLCSQRGTHAVASCGGWWSGNFEKRRAPLPAPHSRSDVWWMNLPSPSHSMHPLDVHRVGRACVRVRVCVVCVRACTWPFAVTVTETRLIDSFSVYEARHHRLFRTWAK